MNFRIPRFDRGVPSGAEVEGIRARKYRVVPSVAVNVNSRSSPGAAPSGTTTSLSTPFTRQVNVAAAALEFSQSLQSALAQQPPPAP